MDKSYIAGFCDGDGSICIGKCNDGFLLKVEFTQCNKDYLDKINEYFENKGKLYIDKRKKYNHEQAYQLRYCGAKAKPILEIMAEHAVLKAPQAKIALEFLSLVNKPNKHQEKESYRQRVKAMNKDKTSYEKDYTKINNAYIAGLFDAEGNVYISDENVSKFKYYVKITQKSDHILVKHIQKHLGFGNITPSENYRIRFYNKENVTKFLDVVRQYSIIKLAKLQLLVDKLCS